MYKNVLIGILAVTTLASCASISSVEEVRGIALEAKEAANKAVVASDVALQKSNMTSSKLDTMFKKSMMK